MILTYAICSSVIGLHPDLKRACPSEKIRSHVFMNRGIRPKHFTKFLMIFKLLTEWVTRGFGLNVRRRRCVHGTGGARRPTTPIPNQRTRASSVGKTSSFSFCQVDMYELGKLS